MSWQRVLIVGASGRAAAASALRAGFEPVVLDLFADADTQRLCEVRRLPMAEYPHGFVAMAAALPPMPWLYTGGLENYPEVVAAISATRELWGNGPEVLAKVRDPLSLAALLKAGRQQGRMAMPRTCESSVSLDPSVRWLRKPRRGAGGSEIRFATAEDRENGGPDVVLQEYVAGTPVSVAFVSGRQPTDWLGMTRQLVGETWLHARPFQHCGNVGLHWSSMPGMCDASKLQLWIERSIPLRGPWGIDFIDDGATHHVLELNPRYPASFEIFEFRKGVAFLAHLDGSQIVPRWKVPAPPKVLIGKAIYYAPHAVTVPASAPWDEALATCTDVWRRPDFADIPHAGDAIAAGHPVCTIFAEAATEDACVAKLKARAAELDRLFADQASRAP